MKRLLFIIAVVMTVASCSTLKSARKVVTNHTVLYTTYNDEGFLITPYEYTHEYNSVGDLMITVVPAIKRTYIADGRYGMLPEPVSYQELTRMAVEQAKKMGADALVDFKITRVDRMPTKDDRNKCWYEYVITGFCIQRKAAQVEITE